MKEYIALDPRTGLPLSPTQKVRRKRITDAYEPPEGAWDAIRHFDVLPLCKGDIRTIEIRWNETPSMVTRKDAVKALPRIVRKDPAGVKGELIRALNDEQVSVRISALFSLPYCAIVVEPVELFDRLDALLDDEDAQVRHHASQCLIKVTPIFPSAIENILYRELREPSTPRRNAAFKGLRKLAAEWPEVAVTHIDELMRIDNNEIRVEASKLLKTLAKKPSAGVWDLIQWSLLDDIGQVRANAAKTLPTLANESPQIAKVLIESSLFDVNASVRKSALRALRSVDLGGPRMKTLCLDGARHSDPEMRQACIMMIPRLFTESEMIEQADLLLRHETKPNLIKILEEMVRDPEVDGGEDEKNRFLAPAPMATTVDGTPLPLPELVERDGLVLAESAEESGEEPNSPNTANPDAQD